MSDCKQLRTARLLLRDWVDDDLPAFAALNADSRVMQHFPAPLSRAESDRLAGRIRQSMSAQGFGLWAVEVPNECEFIGFVGLATVHFEAHLTPAVEVGWRLSTSHWGRGLATEAALAALAFGFCNLGLDEIVSFTTLQNRTSWRVMERLGMHRDPDGDFDHPRVPEGHALERHVLYRLTREQYLRG